MMDLIAWHDILRAYGWRTDQLWHLDRLRSRAERQELEYTQEYKRLYFARHLYATGRLSDGAPYPGSPTLGQITAAIDYAGGISQQPPSYSANPNGYPDEPPDYGG